MKELAIITPGGMYSQGVYDAFKEKLDQIFQYDLPQVDLSQYKAVMISNTIDEEFLYKHKEIISTYLDNGGIICSFAQNFKLWLPGNSLYTLSPTPIKDRVINVKNDHLIFKGITEYDLNYRKGVKGFFNRGYFQEPEGAEVVLTDSDDKTVMYIDRKTTKGTILSGAGTDLITFGFNQGTTVDRLAEQFLEWIEDEVARMKGVNA